MATVQEVLAEDLVLGAKLILIYDDATLIASGVTITAPVSVDRPCKVAFTLKNGHDASQTLQPNQLNQIFNIPNNRRPQGVRKTTAAGLPTIDWGIQVNGISFG